MKIVLVGATTVLAAGCFTFSSGNFRNLPVEEQDRFQRCQMPIRAINCPGLADEFSVTHCVNTLRSHYADTDSPAVRKLWLVENGCQPSMVEPEKYVAQDNRSREAPQSTLPTTPLIVSSSSQNDGFDPLAIHQLASTYDEFKDRTTTSSSSSLGNGITLYLFAVSAGRSPSEHVTSMRLGVAEESDKAKHADRPSLIFLVDRRRFIAANLSRAEVVAAGGRLSETISTSMSLQELKAMATATQVRGQLDSTEFLVSAQASADIRAFAERVGAVAPAPTVDGSEYWLPPKPGGK